MRRLQATVRDPASPEAPPLRKGLLQATSSGEETVQCVCIKVDYGQPIKRTRDT